jgi:hypothetical protein
VLSVPTAIAFQGFLADSGGTPLDGTVDLDIALYDAPAGGNRVWPVAAPEAHAGVPVHDGVFQIAIGGIDPLVPDDFDGSPLYLGISVNSEAELPRTQLLSTPFAIRAERADQADSFTGTENLTTTGTATVGDGSASALTVNGSVQINLPDGPGPFGTGGMTISHPHDPASPFIRLGHATHTWTILHTGIGGNDLKIDDGSSGTADLIIGDDGSLVVGGTTQTGGFQMPTGAAAGHVLTSDGAGVGTWQAPGGDSDWTLNAGLLSADPSALAVGIGNTNPLGTLGVHGTSVPGIFGYSIWAQATAPDGGGQKTAGSFFADAAGTGTNHVGVSASASSGATAGCTSLAVAASTNQGSNSGDTFLYQGLATGTGSGTEFGLYLQGEEANIVNGSLGVGTGLTPAVEKLQVVGNVFASAGDFYAAAANGVLNCGGGIMNANANIIADATPTPTVATGDEDLFIGGDLEVVGNGFKTGGGSWATLSDARLKSDVRPFEDGLETVLRIEPVRFRYSETSGLGDGREYVGVTAQDMLDVAPFMVEERALWQTVVEDEAGKETVIDPGKPYYTFDPSALDYMLINAVKEQQALIREQREVIEALQRRVATLEGAR